MKPADARSVALIAATFVLLPVATTNSQNYADSELALAAAHRQESLDGDSSDGDVHKEERLPGERMISWGPTCYGFNSPWSPCNEQCFQVRTFRLVMAINCTDYHHFAHGSKAYKVCSGGACRLSPDHRGPLEEIFRGLVDTGLNSQLVESGGELLEACQLYIHLMIFATICLVAVMRNSCLKLPEICVCIPAAATFALLIRFAVLGGVNFGESGMVILGLVVFQAMTTILLPLMFFEGAYHIQRKNFWSQFFYGLVIAVPGTLLTAFMIAALVKFSGDFGWHPVRDWRQAFAFAFAFAPVDAVAALSICNNLEVDALLTTLITIESTLNDPVSLVALDILNVPTHSVDFDLFSSLVDGLSQMVGSILFGTMLGIVLGALIVPLRIRSTGALETTYVSSCGYVAFSLGEVCGLSGIIMTLFTGLMMGVYGRDMVDDQHGVSHFLHKSVKLAEVVMFVLVGFGVFLLDSYEGVVLGLLNIGFCILSRAIVMLMLIPFINAAKLASGSPPINFGVSFALFWSGVRGGVTLMLTFQVNSLWATDKKVMVDASIVSVIGLAYISGWTTPWILSFCGVPIAVDQEDGTLHNDSYMTFRWLVKADALVRNMLFKALPEPRSPSVVVTADNDGYKSPHSPKLHHRKKVHFDVDLEQETHMRRGVSA